MYMRRGILLALTGLILGGCLEKVDPISNSGGIIRTGAGPGSVILAWQPPTENADGTPLTDLSGYTIYIGTDSDSYDFREIRLDNPGLTSYVVENLDPGTYYFAATAVNSSGIESHYSGEIVRTVSP
jgi:hypothetical protein